MVASKRGFCLLSPLITSLRFKLNRREHHPGEVCTQITILCGSRLRDS